MLFFLAQGYRVIAHDRRGHGRSTQTPGGHDLDHYADDLHALVEHLDLHDAIHVGHSTGGGEVVRFLARHGESRASKAAIISAVPPLMVQTDANPEGLPKSVFDDLQAQLAANRSEFYRALPSGPFYNFDKPGVESVGSHHRELVAPGDDGRRAVALRRHRRVLADRLHRGPEEDHRPDSGDAQRRRPDRAVRGGRARSPPSCCRTARSRPIATSSRTACPPPTPTSSTPTCWPSCGSSRKPSEYLEINSAGRVLKGQWSTSPSAATTACAYPPWRSVRETSGPGGGTARTSTPHARSSTGSPRPAAPSSTLRRPTRWVSPRSSSARSSPAAGRTSPSPPSSPSGAPRRAAGCCRPATVGGPCSGRSSTACAAWTPTTSTYCGCTGRTSSPRSRRSCARIDDLVSSGKVLYAGLSNFPAWLTARGVTLAEVRGLVAGVGRPVRVFARRTHRGPRRPADGGGARARRRPVVAAGRRPADRQVPGGLGWSADGVEPGGAQRGRPGKAATVDEVIAVAAELGVPPGQSRRGVAAGAWPALGDRHRADDRPAHRRPTRRVPRRPDRRPRRRALRPSRRRQPHPAGAAARPNAGATLRDPGRRRFQDVGRFPSA